MLKRSKKIFLRYLLSVLAVMLVLISMQGRADAATFGSRTLRQGMYGSDVQVLQEKLNNSGVSVGVADGIFGGKTANGVIAFQRVNGLLVDGIVGSQTFQVLQNVSLSSRQTTVTRYTVQWGDNLTAIAQKFNVVVSELIQVNHIKNSNIIYVGQVLSIPGKSVTSDRSGDRRFGQLMDWEQVNKMFPVGTDAIVTDLLTQKSFKVRRMGGSLHADVEPITATDTAMMKDIYGGQWSWERRAIVVTMDGQRIAASQNGMPHTIYDNIKNNNFKGLFCIHFYHSKKHYDEQQDTEHQAMVKKAAGL